MPIHDYLCGNCGCTEEVFYHSTETVTQIIKCSKCGEAAKRMVALSNVSASGLGVRGSSSVYWPSKGIAQGRMVEHLTPKPVYVQNKEQYRKLLKSTGCREKE